LLNDQNGLRDRLREKIQSVVELKKQSSDKDKAFTVCKDKLERAEATLKEITS